VNVLVVPTNVRARQRDGTNCACFLRHEVQSIGEGNPIFHLEFRSVAALGSEPSLQIRRIRSSQFLVFSSHTFTTPPSHIGGPLGCKTCQAVEGLIRSHSMHTCFRGRALNGTRVGQWHVEPDSTCGTVLLYRREYSCCNHGSFGNSRSLMPLPTLGGGRAAAQMHWVLGLDIVLSQRVSPAWNEHGALFSSKRDNSAILN
jgi:hypothetical protein